MNVNIYYLCQIHPRFGYAFSMSKESGYFGVLNYFM